MHNCPHPQQPHQITLPFANPRIWEQLPDCKRQACRDLVTELLLHVIHNELSEASHDPSQD